MSDALGLNERHMAFLAQKIIDSGRSADITIAYLNDEIERLGLENRDLREVGLAAFAYSESTRDRAYGDPNLRWRELNDVLAYRRDALGDTAPLAAGDPPA